MKFRAEVVDYRLSQGPSGTKAIIKLEVNKENLDDSYFLGGLISKEATFKVEEVYEDIDE